MARMRVSAMGLACTGAIASMAANVSDTAGSESFVTNIPTVTRYVLRVFFFGFGSDFFISDALDAGADITSEPPLQAIRK